MTEGPRTSQSSTQDLRQHSQLQRTPPALYKEALLSSTHIQGSDLLNGFSPQSHLQADIKSLEYSRTSGNC